MKIVFAAAAALALSATTALAGDLTVKPASTYAAALHAGPTLMSDAQMDAVVGAGDPPFNDWPPSPANFSGNAGNAPDTVAAAITPPPWQ